MNDRYESIRKLVCDVCGGNITMQAGGQVGICSCCGLNYSIERMREIVSGVKVSQTGSAEDVEQWRELVKKYMDSGAFEDAEGIVKKILEAIPNDAEANRQYDELQNLKYIHIRNGVLVGYDGRAEKVNIPAMVNRIQAGAFANNLYLREITFSEGCQVIEGNAFKGCASLHSVQLPDSIQIIWINAFENCTALKQIEIPHCVQTMLGQCLFKGCTALENVTLPVSLKAIENETFMNCTSLKSIVIPDSVETIGENAFKGCTALEKIELSDNIHTVGAGAFENCSALVKAKLPKSMKTLNHHTFKNCTSLAEIALPDELETIQGGAFACCVALKEIRFPDSLKGIYTYGDDYRNSRGTYYEDGAFYNCRSLSEIKLPDGIKRIETYAFFDCTSLAIVHQPDRQQLDHDNSCGWPYGGTKYDEERLRKSQEEYERKKEEEKQKKISAGICPECGGTLSFFGNRCKKCGRQF